MIRFSTHDRAPRISIGAPTKFLTNNDVSILELGKFEFENECET